MPLKFEVFKINAEMGYNEFDEFDDFGHRLNRFEIHLGIHGIFYGIVYFKGSHFFEFFLFF